MHKDFLNSKIIFWRWKNSQEIHGIGAVRKGTQATMHELCAAPQPKIANGVPRPTVTVPKVNPAAFDSCIT